MSISLTCPTCGYTHTYSSEAQAGARHARHSCQRQLRRLQQQARIAARELARASRPVRPCHHTGTPHRHGMNAAYTKDGCRCPACTAAHTATDERRRRARAYERWNPFVDAEPARSHVLGLLAAGQTLQWISHATAVPPRQLRDLAVGRSGGKTPTQRIRQQTARKILREDSATPASAFSRVDAKGTRRRLEALAVIGWSQHALARALGRRTRDIERWQHATTVTAGTADLVNRVYGRLKLRPPPEDTAAKRRRAERTLAHALSNGWLAPLAWDDIDVDPDPVPTPPARGRRERRVDIDDVAVERAMDGDASVSLTREETTEAVRRLTENGHSITEIAERLHVGASTVSRHRDLLRNRQSHSGFSEAA